MIDPPPRQQSAWPIALLVLALCAGGWMFQRYLQRERQWASLLKVDGAAVMHDRELTNFAIAEARPLYTRHCVRCHGADLKGQRTNGAPNLVDSYWLYGDGSVFDIERTILYGVRSGYGKSHNVTDMPAFGLTGRLSSDEIRDLVQYLLQLSGQPHQATAATAGRALYFDVAKANCADCHGESAQGNADYGAPNLSVDVWRTGDDAQQFYQAIYSGQHRSMPGWFGALNLAQIRALAVYVYAMSHGASGSG